MSARRIAAGVVALVVAGALACCLGCPEAMGQDCAIECSEGDDDTACDVVCEGAE